MKYYLGVDLGGTNIAVGIVAEDGTLLTKTSARTDISRGAQGVCADIAALCRSLCAEGPVAYEDIAGIGLGCPGVVLGDIAVAANNLKFDNDPIADMLRSASGKPVRICNDVNAAALGEYVAGAGRGSALMATITIGTGIGCGIVSEGKIVAGADGSAGELGHIIVIENGRECACGRKGCLEAYCCATAIRKISTEAMQRDKSSLMWAICEDDIENVSAATMFRAAEQGDATARALVDEFHFCLARGISTLINILNPEIICLGGGIAREGEKMLAPVRALVKPQVFISPERVEQAIVSASLGNDAGIIGAAWVGMDR